LAEPNAFVEREAELFKALAHPTRLRILRLLAGEPWCVCDLSGRLALDQPNVSQHLAVLRSAGLVRARREGGRMVYRLAGPGVEELLEVADRWLRSSVPPRVG
jgi:DNA-binding transcriptional ArsR family regulator